MKMRVNKYLMYIAKMVLFFAVFFVLFVSSVNSTIFPFAFGMMFALVWANQKVWIVVPTYIAAGALFCPTLEFAICLLVTSFCLIVPYFIHVLYKKVMKKWELALFAILGHSANIVFEVLGGLHPALSLLELCFGILFMFACINIFEAFIIRGFTNKLTSLEIVCMFAIIASVSGGLVKLNIGTFSFLKLFACLMILIFTFCATPTITLMASSIPGLGALVATNNPVYIAPFVIWTLICLLLKKRFRIFMTIGIVCVEIVIGFYFKLYATFGIFDILPVLIACAIFMCLPKSWCNEIAVVFNLSKDRIAMKNVVNRNRELLHKRLGNLSEIFNDMNIIYRNMMKSNMSLDDIKNILQQEIFSKVCSFCPERHHCHRTFAENTKSVFDGLITISYEKGKATLLDMPSYLTSRCKQTNAILSGINTLTEQYKKYMTMVKDVDTSKVILAEQLLGVSQIMGNLAKEVETNVSFDTIRENKILDELTYHNIICIDAVVYQKDIWTMEVSLVVKNEDSAKQRIVDVVSKVCGCKMGMYESFSSHRPGYSVLNLRTAPKFDCVFGVSQKTKNGSKVSGDTYSIIKLNGDKILFVINDGMGSGERAEKTSELAISLVENFYKAGFDNELILSTINKLLSLHKEEIFSALDICILDQKNGLADFIKMASPNSYILGEDECKVVETGALPIGIVEDSKPKVNKHVIEAKDFVILLSDGVSDSFENEEEISSCIKSIRTRNPQEFADCLLEKALQKNNGYAVDDMTIIAIKILNF